MLDRQKYYELLINGEVVFATTKDKWEGAHALAEQTHKSAHILTREVTTIDLKETIRK